MISEDMEEIKFPVKLKLRLDWSELDQFGHVNNVMYFKYFQSARVNYWETLKMNNLFAENRIAPILASVKCDFIKPLHYPGEIWVLSKMEYIGNTSFGLDHRIISDKNEVVAEGHDILVWYDYQQNTKIPFPEKYLNSIKQLEGSLPVRK